MDRIINNEVVTICSILNALVLNVDDIARLNMFSLMTTDYAIRGRMIRYDNYSEMIKKESSYNHALNRKFVEFQPVFLNAMTMLLVGGMVEKKNFERYGLTEDGFKMASGMQGQQGVMEIVRQAGLQLESMIRQKGAATWYKDLKIVL